MAASRGEVDGWIVYAKENGYPFIISVCDTWDYNDYPVYCKTIEEVREKSPRYSTNMQKINEVIEINPDGSVKEKPSFLG